MKNILKLFLISITFIPISVFAYDKNEFVYTNIDSSGKEIKKVVNNELKLNYKGNVEDDSLLKDIVNINGNEKFDKNNNMITWKSKGKDIFYQGKIDKENPVDVDIEYYLNDKKIDYKKLHNKSGNIKIIYHFTNKLYDSNYNLHTPFVVSVINNINGRNVNDIEVNNGKGINTGNRHIALGIAAPSLYEDLDINELDDFDEVIISFSTDKFKSLDSYLVMSPKVLDKLDLGMFNKIDGYNNSINELQEGVNKLSSGSNELNDGINAYTNGVNKVNNGSKDVLNGISSAVDGAKKLEEGNSSVDANLKQIIEGLKLGEKELADKSSELNSKINEISQLRSVNSNTIKTIEDGNNLIVNGVLNQTGGSINISTLSLEELTNQLNYLVSVGMLSEEQKNSIINYKNSYDNNINLINLIKTNDNSIDLLTNSLITTSKSISDKLSEIDTYLSQLQQFGTSQISSGSSDLREGIERLYSGSSMLFNGINELDNQSSKLNDGSNLLKNGIDTLNKNGISKLTSIFRQINNKSDKVKLLTKLSKSYNGFSSSNSTNSTFIYKVNY